MKPRTVRFCWISVPIVLVALIFAYFLIKAIGNGAIFWVVFALFVTEMIVYYFLFVFPLSWFSYTKNTFHYLRKDLKGDVEFRSVFLEELLLSAQYYKDALIKMKDIYGEDARFSEAYLQQVEKKLERRLSPMNRDRVYKKYLASKAQVSRLKTEIKFVDDELKEVEYFELQLISSHPMPPNSFS